MESGIILAVTGHRHHKLGIKDLADHERLVAFAKSRLIGGDIKMVLTGMATGWDLAVAQAAHELKIPFTAAIPYTGQELLFPGFYKKIYRHLISIAPKNTVVNVSGENYYSGAFLLERNSWLVKNCDILLALLDPDVSETSGTFHTVKLAEHLGKQVCEVWHDYEVYNGIIKE